MDEPEALRARYADLLEQVRRASRAGNVVRLDDVCGGSVSGAAEVVSLDEAARESVSGAGVQPAAGTASGAGVSPAALIALAERGGLDDLAVVQAGRRTYLYSTRHMTRQYAEMAARRAEGDIPRLIAETVRADSATYPRPTPVETFAGRPFDLTADQIAPALVHLSADAAFDDIRKLTASDGTVFLYSARHLEPAHAASLAEWLAVGRANNP